MSATGPEPDFNLSDPDPGAGFKTVTRKGRKGKFERTHPPNDLQKPSTLDSPFDKESAIRRIEEAKSELISTDLYDSIVASLREALSTLDEPNISAIISLGLGKIGECTTSRYQFALLLCLRSLYQVPVSVYDPVFDKDDLSIFEHFNVKVLSDNTEGKHRISNNETVLYYLPHCPKQLSNNLLWVNWGLGLRCCIIIANSFHTIIERNSARALKGNAEYVSRILPYVLELPVINSFKYYEVFNDTAIHVFPRLNLVSQDFWKDCTEPVYSEDLEFIKNHS